MRRPIVGLILTMMASSNVAAQTACEAVLKWGVRDTQKIFNSNYDFKQTQFYICNSSYQTAGEAESASAAIGIPIGGLLAISFGGAAAKSNYQTWRANLCSSTVETIQNNNQFISETKTTSTAITDAWSKCTANGFFGYISPTKDPTEFKIKLEFKTNGSNGVKVNSFAISSGASCSPPFKPKETFSGSKEWLCKRGNGARPVAFVVNTSQGPTSGELPGYIPEVPAPGGACSSGNSTGQCLSCEFDLKNFGHIDVGSSVSYSCPKMPAGALVSIHLTGTSSVDESAGEGTWVRYQLMGPGIQPFTDAAGAANTQPITISSEARVPADGLVSLALFNRLAQYGDGRVVGHTNKRATIVAGKLAVQVVAPAAKLISRGVLNGLVK